MSNSLFTIRGGRVIDLAPFTVMGIVNITPDSFSDGGQHFEYGEARDHALLLLKQGARILDLGGESTRPGSLPVSEAEECRRVVPLVKELNEIRSRGHAETADLLISVDTWRAGTAAASLEAGADIINDISGGRFDPALPEVLAAWKPGYILGHCPAPPATMQNAPHYADVVEEIYAFFAEQMESLIKAGLPEDRIVLDPCPGFGKNLQHNLALLRNLDRLHQLGRPLCIAISRKTLIGDLLGLPARADADASASTAQIAIPVTTLPHDPAKQATSSSVTLPGAAKQVTAPPVASPRDPASQVLTALLYGQGACLHRVHDVAGAWNALRLAQALQG